MFRNRRPVTGGGTALGTASRRSATKAAMTMRFASAFQYFDRDFSIPRRISSQIVNMLLECLQHSNTPPLGLDLEEFSAGGPALSPSRDMRVQTCVQERRVQTVFSAHVQLAQVCDFLPRSGPRGKAVAYVYADDLFPLNLNWERY